MKCLWFLPIVLLACGRTEPVADASVPAPDAQAAASREVAHLSLRHQDYSRHQAIEVPAALTPYFRSLVPAAPTVAKRKLVAFALERNMALTQPAPGRRKVMVRWIAPEDASVVRAGLVQDLKGLGWTVTDPELRSPLVDATRGRLAVVIEAKNDEATRAELVLDELETSETPMENPLALLKRPVDWLDDTEATVVGFELAHYHAVRFKGADSDLMRLAVQVRLADSAVRDALLLRLPDRVEQAGYRLEAKESGLYRGEDGGIFVVRPAAAERELIIHHQQRWTFPTAL